MTKKIALVDIDGCIIHENKLNHALVEQLRQYDEVILFTQRSIYLQSAQIPRKVLDLNSQMEDLVCTPDVVRALSLELKKKITVCTSIDRFYSKYPTQYYEQVLEPFEKELKDEVSQVKKDEEYKFSQPLRKKYSTETKMVWGSTLQDGKKELNENEPSSYYPVDKIEQYRYLRKALPQMMGDNDLKMTYFDDNLDNLTEVMKATQPNPPKCLIVKQSYICPVDKFLEDSEKHSKQKKIDEELQGTSLARLCNYVVLREGERRASQSEYKSHWARCFTPNTGCATTKINAANKAIKILQGYTDFEYVLTEKELEALQQGRLMNAIGLSFAEVKNFCEERVQDTYLTIIS